VSTGIALVTVWAGIALSYRTNWPLGFYVGVIAAGFFLLGQGWAAARRHGSAIRPQSALAPASDTEPALRTPPALRTGGGRPAAPVSRPENCR